MDSLYQSLVAVEPFTLVVTILNLFLQLFLIKKFLLDKIMAVLEQRRQMADAQIADAEAAKQEALALRQTYEENMENAKQEAGQILRDAQRNATLRSEEIIHTAQEQASQLKQKAAEDIAQEKKKALNDAKDQISEIAMTIAGKVVGRNITDGDQARLVEQFIDELGENG